jgi:large subunit ribosomal protein L5
MSEENQNPMRIPKLEKVVINIGVGEGGQRLANAEKILEAIANQKPARTYARKSAFIRKGQPIGCKVTLRGKKGEDFLRKALEIKKPSPSNFDESGNLSFGIEEHTDFSGMKYHPDVGIFGMDVCVSLKRPGYRLSKRRMGRGRIPAKHRLLKRDAIDFIKGKYGIGIEMG